MLSFRTRALGFCTALAGLVSFVACASSEERSGFQNGDGGNSSGGDGGVFANTEGGPALDENGCSEAAKLVYVLSYEGDLYSFAPADKKFKKIGPLGCRLSDQQKPISMAVDRKGVAYILFTDERLYRVSTLNAACLSTSYVPRQSNFGLFGMGFATNDVGPTETLYVHGDRRNTGASGLARIDISTFKLTPVGDPNIEHAELTGNGAGNLFAFYKRSLTGSPPPSYIGQIDTTNGQISGEKKFDDVDQGQGWAFAFWGGSFYMFHAPSGNSLVTRYDPKAGTHKQVASLPSIIVGAGVSTCAPQQ